MAGMGVPPKIRIPGDIIAAISFDPSAKRNNPPTVQFFHDNDQSGSDVRLPEGTWINFCELTKVVMIVMND